MSNRQRWLPAVILAVGALLVQTVGRQLPTPLPHPLSDLPNEFDGYRGQDVVISKGEQKVAGMSSYVSRLYSRDSSDVFSIYVGYYDQQMQGKSIHSPKNCLPGAGWEPMQASEKQIQTADGPVPVNRYVIAKGAQKALVYYWYQGRGRVAANEYRVKLQLIRDAAVRRRTDEALVRIVVPMTTTEAAAEQLATSLAQQLVPELDKILPS